MVDAKRIIQIRAIVRELPPACEEFIQTIAVTTGTFTRLAYAIDLRTFFNYLQTERYHFAQKDLQLFDDADMAQISQGDITAYIEYLTLYFKESDEDSPKAYVNHEKSIKRKLCALRSFFDYLFRNKRIPANITQLVSLPKIHEKPIIRLSDEETKQFLSVIQTGEKLSAGQEKFRELTVKRDYAMMMLFLGTGIRVSECVGLNLADVNL